MNAGRTGSHFVPETLNRLRKSSLPASLGVMSDTSQTLARQLLQALRPFAHDRKEGDSSAGVRPHGAQLFSYCCFEMERLARVSNEKPVIGIVLSGAKEFWLGDAGQRFVAGDVFIFPARVEVDVVNVPAEGNGIYESLLVEVDSVPESIRQLRPAGSFPHQGLDMRVPLTSELVEALTHAAAVLAASDHATALAQHRLAEVLLLLRTVPAAACLYDMSLADRVAWVVLKAPAHRWTAQDIGRALGMGASTLRRRLSGEGTSLRDVLASTRMKLAHEILTRGDGNVTAAAGAAGYSSRSHFGRQFRNVYEIGRAHV